MNYRDFEYYDEDKLPKLVLAIDCGAAINKETRKYNFKHGKRWKMVVHQTGGLGCNQKFMYLIRLEPKSKEIRLKMKELCDFWFDSNVGVFGTCLNEINEYDAQLRELFDVDCNLSFIDFEEAIYPIDCTVENLAKMTSTKLPDQLNDFVEWKSDFDRFVGGISRWKLFILGENSD